MKYVRFIALTLTFFVLFIAICHAATPTVTVSWTAPTKYDDGTTISSPLTYQLYVGASGQEVKFGNPVTSPPYVITTGIPAPGKTLCVQVTATANGIESAKTPEACATIPYPRPVTPVQVTVTVK